MHTDKNPIRGKCQTWRFVSKDRSIRERIKLPVNLAVGKTEKQVSPSRWVTQVEKINGTGGRGLILQHAQFLPQFWM